MFLTSLCLAASLVVAADAPPPKVLILGDSISIGYTPYVKEQLSNVADVVRPKENCAGTLYGMTEVQRWVSEAGNPAVITFNFGLHDLKRVDPKSQKPSNDPLHPRQSDPEKYRQQLTQIVDRLQATGAKLAFVTTTPVPSGGVKPHRDVGDVLYYNAIARSIVEPRGIEVIDLFDVALPKLADWQKPVNVHFNETGSRELAQTISSTVKRLLQSPQAAPAESWTAPADLVAKLSDSRPFNYREENVPQYTLPDPLVNRAGKTVTADQWPARRAETLQLFEDHFFGKPPAAVESLALSSVVEKTDDAAADGIAIGKQIRLTLKDKEREFSFPMLLFTPKNASSPAPVFVLINNREFPDLLGATRQPIGFLPVAMLIQQGFAVATFHTSDVDPDRADGRAEGIRGFGDPLATEQELQAENAWGAIAAWSWGASRVLDYLETEPTVNAKAAAVIGHSRGGKTALWTGARDTRFKVAISNESGCGGAALSRRHFGETIARITTAFPHWFCRRLNDYAEAEAKLPIDQHQLVGLIAPRKVYVASAEEDLWADPRGEYLSLVHAAPVFELLGKDAINSPSMPRLGESRIVGQTGYHLRAGKHNLTEGDWIRFLEFVKE